MANKKQKTHSSTKKRVKKQGKNLKRKHAFKSHILTKKSKKRKRNLTKTGAVHKSDENAILKQLRAK